MVPGIDKIQHAYSDRSFTSLCGRYSGALNGVLDEEMCEQCVKRSKHLVEKAKKAADAAHKKWLNTKTWTRLLDRIKPAIEGMDKAGLEEILRVIARWRAGDAQDE